ncbi:retrovirus-related Pol polyprotein from transposon 297 [Trichonephila clavipes]|nr:retrovirus-related Pol polyprotein from transposon 297 [Trichonephila clavipes]
MVKEIKAYCSSCHGCQLRKVIRSVDKIPITPVSRPELLFQVVNVDLIGPVDPVSSQGHKYILCLMDQHSRWPEAIPLKSLTAKSTCEALLKIFSRTGIPEVIVMDNATNFTASLTHEFLKILGACPRFSTPYHPEGNGLIERWNQTLKNMLHHIIREEGRSWHRHIPFLLWAYREVPNATTGTPPFLLMYGRDPKGPLSILKSIWTGNTLLPLNMKGSVESYLKKLKEKLEIATHKAKLTSDVQQGSYAKYYNRQKKHREFAPGDQVLVLIPDSTNKLYARWTGPVKVVKRVKPNSYYLQMAGGNLRLLHVNKIREYRARVQTVGVIYDIDDEFGEIYETPTVPAAEKNDEALDRVTLDYLSKKQQAQLKDLLHRHRTLFSGKIKRAKVGEHVIKLKKKEETMKPKTYKIPENLKRKVDVQIDELLELGMIEPVVSEIAHPVVCVHKKDGTIRLCIDFRSLNALTVPDAYPMQNMMELNFLVGKKKFITVLDMLKGYWSIPMEDSSKHLTAFRIHRGQYQCNVLPFGLRNAAATYQRAMSKVVQTISDFACAYIDDLAIFSDTWEEHLNHLEIVFKRLEHFNFSVNLGKCEFARQKVKYLGHVIGSVYSELCKIALPLTELTKKKVPNEISWSKEAENTFKELKTALCGITELQVPDIEKPYYLHTDASQTAVGCCLGQLYGEDNIHPIAFGSQKLNPSQQKWSTIEREAYAIIWALKRFETLLCGAKIFLLTDHNPLVFLTSATPQCPRLQMWALAIQRHDIEASHMKGSKLVNADALSRL